MPSSIDSRNRSQLYLSHAASFHNRHAVDTVGAVHSTTDHVPGCREVATHKCSLGFRLSANVHGGSNQVQSMAMSDAGGCCAYKARRGSHLYLALRVVMTCASTVESFPPDAATAMRSPGWNSLFCVMVSCTSSSKAR